MGRKRKRIPRDPDGLARADEQIRKLRELEARGRAELQELRRRRRETAG